MRLLVQKLLPFDFAEASEFRAFLKLITKNSAPKIAIQRVKHIILEMYSATKEVGVSRSTFACRCIVWIVATFSRVVLVTDETIYGYTIQAKLMDQSNAHPACGFKERS